MADLITLTSAPIRGTAAGSARLETSRDVLAYDLLDIQAEVVGFETPGATPGIVVNILTGLQLDTTDGWFVVGSTGTLSGPGTASAFGTIKLSGTFLRYVRWSVSSWGTQAAATWWIRGMARPYTELRSP